MSLVRGCVILYVLSQYFKNSWFWYFTHFDWLQQIYFDLQPCIFLYLWNLSLKQVFYISYFTGEWSARGKLIILIQFNESLYSRLFLLSFFRFILEEKSFISQISRCPHFPLLHISFHRSKNIGLKIEISLRLGCPFP